MTDQEKITRLECLLAEYVHRYGALPETNRYFVDASQTNDGRFEPCEKALSRSPIVVDEVSEKNSTVITGVTAPVSGISEVLPD